MPEIQQRILELSQRVLRGEIISDNELREALQFIRYGRAAAQSASTTKAEKRTASGKSSEDILALFTTPKNP